MKYPQTKEEAKEAIKYYDGMDLDGHRALSISVKRDQCVKDDEDPYLCATDIQTYETEGEVDVLIKSCYIERLAFEEDAKVADSVFMPLEDFLRVAETIKAYYKDRIERKDR